MTTVTEDLYDQLEQRALVMYQQAAQEWLAGSPEYQRLLRLAENPELKLCLAFEEQPLFADWQEADLLPEDLAEQQLVEFTLFYADAADEENKPQEVVLKLLISAEPDNDFCVLAWFPD